ncbi:MAG: glucose-6-phosphate isomerase [Gemmatimonadetes bacterium]|nr:MAG: glucose-6-phosphate isomerase [Gemmatimonadota bacterium]
MSIRIDYTNMLTPAVGSGGVDPQRLGGDLQERFARARDAVAARRAGGALGFLDLPHDLEAARGVAAVAESFGQWFENLVVVGIGGSALGARAVRDGLLGPLWNQWSDERREHYPRLYVLDNPDPSTVRALLDELDLTRTLFNVVSKSGSTAETMALYLVIEGRLRALVGDEAARGHFLFTTDPERGALRAIAEAEGIPALSIPPNVGGRFSVLSPVGLFPAAATGVDIEALLGGARTMAERCEAPALTENPAGLLATLLHVADSEYGRPIHVLMPYHDRLRAFALWYQQLWAESLGKHTPGGGHVGPTPLPALGAVDQHAQVQLFMEGPHDKVVVFVRAEPHGDPVAIPDHRGADETLGYLAGHTLAELLDAERRATTEALRRGGRPSLTIDAGRLDAEALGGLFLLWEYATVYAGALYGVDPLDQPGVELGKRLTYGLMGRPGFEAPEPGATDGTRAV